MVVRKYRYRLQMVLVWIGKMCKSPLRATLVFNKLVQSLRSLANQLTGLIHPLFSRITKSLKICSLTIMCISVHYLWLPTVFKRVKTKTSAKYGLEAQPRLVDIIAAVPPQYRRVLVPKLKAKPIRTASGVRSLQVSVWHSDLEVNRVMLSSLRLFAVV